LVIADEESYLQAMFGQPFTDYCRKTPRLFPNPLRYSHATGQIPVNLKALRREAVRL
jgi:hypothetical protein